MLKDEWFKNWFDSPFYHILYRNRDLKEAKTFIANLTGYLSLDDNSRVLDLGCGKGRHSIELNKYYDTVKGIDLSSNSIKIAKKHESNELTFQIEDMRNFKSVKKFNAIFNLFTSFGYFKDYNENLKVLRSCNNALTEQGIIIIDFLNAFKIKVNIQKYETKIIGGIKFQIERKIENDKILKTILFEHENKSYNFEEKVQLFTLNNFNDMFKQTGFKLLSKMGNYQLHPFEPKNSDRLILIAKKI